MTQTEAAPEGKSCKLITTTQTANNSQRRMHKLNSAKVLQSYKWRRMLKSMMPSHHKKNDQTFIQSPTVTHFTDENVALQPPKHKSTPKK